MDTLGAASVAAVRLVTPGAGGPWAITDHLLPSYLSSTDRFNHEANWLDPANLVSAGLVRDTAMGFFDGDADLRGRRTRPAGLAVDGYRIGGRAGTRESYRHYLTIILPRGARVEMPSAAVRRVFAGWAPCHKH